MGAGPGRTPVSPSPRVFAKPGGADEGAEGAGVCTGVPGGARTPQPLQPGSATGADGPSSGASGRHMPPVLTPPARQPVGARAAAHSAEMQCVYLFPSTLYPAVGLFVLRPSAKWEERVTSALRGVLVERGICTPAAQGLNGVASLCVRQPEQPLPAFPGGAPCGLQGTETAGDRFCVPASHAVRVRACVHARACAVVLGKILSSNFFTA